MEKYRSANARPPPEKRERERERDYEKKEYMVGMEPDAWC